MTFKKGDWVTITMLAKDKGISYLTAERLMLKLERSGKVKFVRLVSGRYKFWEWVDGDGIDYVASD